MDQQKDGTIRQEGRKEKKKKKKRAATELGKPNEYFYVELVRQGRHKRPVERQRYRGENNNNYHEDKSKRH